MIITKNKFVTYTLMILIILLLFFKIQENLPTEYECEDCNVIIVSIDALRTDHMGVYGYERDTTPHIDELAKESTVFKKAYAQSSWTLPSFISFFTSKYPFQKLTSSDITMAETFLENGYNTAAFTDGGLVSKEYGFNDGFQVYDDGGYLLPSVYLKCESWIKQNKDERFFVWLHTYEVNTDAKSKPLPYGVPESEFKDKYVTYAGNFNGCYKMICGSNFLLHYPNLPIEVKHDELNYITALYDEQVNLVDTYIQRLLEMLEREGIKDKTIIVLQSDHGEEFLEHELFRHGRSLYESELHVPLIIYLPGKEGEVIDYPVRLLDVYPTLLGVTGLPESSDMLEGVNLFNEYVDRPVIAIMDNNLLEQYGIDKPLAKSIRENVTKETTRERWFYNGYTLDLVEIPVPWRTIIEDLSNYPGVELDIDDMRFQFTEVEEMTNSIYSQHKNYYYKIVECDGNTYGLKVLNWLAIHDAGLDSDTLDSIFNSTSCQHVPEDYLLYKTPSGDEIKTLHDKSIQLDGYKLILSKDGSFELYDTLLDEDEAININDIARVNYLKSKLDTELGDYLHEYENQDTSEIDYEMLKSLGYIE